LKEAIAKMLEVRSKVSGGDTDDLGMDDLNMDDLDMEGLTMDSDK